MEKIIVITELVAATTIATESLIVRTTTMTMTITIETTTTTRTIAKAIEEVAIETQ